MATQDDVRRLALALPEVQESTDHFGFGVRAGATTKGFAWAWRERVDPRRPKVPNPSVLAVRVDGLDAKALLLESAPEKFFTEAHYQRSPAVLVRLDAVDPDELTELLVEAWACMAPAALVRRFAEEVGPPTRSHGERP